MKIHPPRIAGLLSLVFGIVGYFFGRIIFYPYNLFGIVVLVFGFVFMMIAHSSFVKNKTGVHPGHDTTKFVVEGVYKYSRNPMYFGMFLMILGAGVVVGSWVSVLACVVFVVVMNKTWIPFEEKKMEKQFGKRYLEYKKRVRRWI